MPTMKGKRVLTSLYLDPPGHAALKALSERTRIPVAVYLREAVDDLLTKYKVSAPAAGQGEEPETKVLKFRSRGILAGDRHFNRVARDLGYESFEKLEEATKAEKARRRLKRAPKKAKATK